MRITQIVVFTLMAVFSFTVMAAVYKWTDSNGMVHYTQEKPLKYKAVKVNAPPPPPADIGNSGQDAASQIQQRGEERKSSGPASSDADADVNKKNCETAKKNLQTLNEYARVKYVDESGAQAVMTEEEKAKRKADAQKNIDYFCK